MAAVSNVEGADYIASYGGFLVVLAPIHIGSTCDTGTVEDMSWFDSRKFSLNGFAIFHANCRGVDDPSLLSQLLDQQACNPAISTPYEENFFSRSVHVGVL